MKYTNLSIVQEACIPVAISGTDVMVKAKTGTGKTLGFLIPTIDMMLKDTPDENAIRCLVLSPTRELAVQISTEATSLLTYHRMRVVTIVGGTNINTDKKNMAGRVDFLVSTPGRLIDHLENTPNFSGRCLRSIKNLIFDEADQLLDMGFRPEIEKILKHMPPKVLRFSVVLYLPSSTHPFDDDFKYNYPCLTN
jgi:ATP-dependent RNA helicase MSS116